MKEMQRKAREKAFGLLPFERTGSGKVLDQNGRGSEVIRRASVTSDFLPRKKQAVVCSKRLIWPRKKHLPTPTDSSHGHGASGQAEVRSPDL